jgi:Uncharacterized protein conserved in bacteria
MQKIIPSLWFDNNCEEALNYYVSVFPDAKILSIKRYPEGITEGPMAGMGGKILTEVFELCGQQFIALDGGPIFKFNEAVSFTVQCKDQDEIDYFWEKLSAVPEAEQCGWVKDQFGLSWQILPENMGELMQSDKAMQVMLQMKKIIIADLEAAAKE